MKKIFFTLFFVLLLISCASKQEEITKKEDPKQILATKLKEETLKEHQKFDKNNTRTKVETLT
jgi:uncharacterized protein YcfL